MASRLILGNQSGGAFRPSRFGRGIATGAVLFMAVGLAIGGARDTAAAGVGSTQVMHFFSKSTASSFMTAAGKSFTPSKTNKPGPGDWIEGTDLDFVGNQMHHAAQWTASDNELCILDSKGNPFCHAEVAIGGSMLLAQGVPSQSATFTLTVTGGTGSFQGVTGTIVIVNLSPNSQNSDATITLHRR